MRVYVLKSCDTCRKALKWLDSQKLDYERRDVRDDGLSREDIALFIRSVGRDAVVNRRSTTWRDLPDASRLQADDDAGAIMLLTEHPTLMKRPVFVSGLQVYVGFDDGTKLVLSEA